MKKLFLFLSLSTLLFSCSDDDNALGPNETIVGFRSSSSVEYLTNDVADAELPVVVRLISYANEQYPDNEIVANWTIIAPEDYLNPDDFATQAEYDAELQTFAQDGVEFDIPSGGSGTLSLAAGQTFTSFPINVHPITLDPDFPKKIVVRLVSASNAIIGAQYQTTVISLQGVCASDLAGDYSLTTGSGTFPVTITALGNGNYTLNAIMLPGGIWVGGSPIPYNFSDVCGQIIIDTPILGGGYYMLGSGTVNPDGSITITYDLYQGGAPSGTPVFANMTGTYYPL